MHLRSIHESCCILLWRQASSASALDSCAFPSSARSGIFSSDVPSIEDAICFTSLKQLGLEPSRPCAKCRLHDLAKPESCIIKGHVFEFRPWKQCYNHLHARLHMIAKHHWNLKLNIFVRRSLSVPLVLRSRSRQVSCRFRHHCFILLENCKCQLHCQVATYLDTWQLLNYCWMILKAMFDMIFDYDWIIVFVDGYQLLTVWQD